MQFGQIWIFYPRLDSNMKENINKRSHLIPHLRQHSKSLGNVTEGPSFYNYVETFACFSWINIDLWTKIANIRQGEITGKTFPPEYNIPKILVRQTHLEFQYLSKDFHHWATWRKSLLEAAVAPLKSQNSKIQFETAAAGGEIFKSVKYLNRWNF